MTLIPDHEPPPHSRAVISLVLHCFHTLLPSFSLSVVIRLVAGILILRFPSQRGVSFRSFAPCDSPSPLLDSVCIRGRVHLGVRSLSDKKTGITSFFNCALG